MRIQATPIDGFVSSLDAWINSILLNRQDHAKIETETLKIFARMLAEDREFEVIYRKNLDGCSQSEPKQAMNCVYAFLNSVTDASRPDGSARHGSENDGTCGGGSRMSIGGSK